MVRLKFIKSDYLDNDLLEADAPEFPVHIAIIGGGPKGIYGLERLVAQCRAQAPTTQIVVHIFNRTEHFAAGEIYHPDQPDFLKMNVCRWEINMWLPDEVPPAVCEPLSFVEWVNASEGIHSHQKKEVFPTRKLVGKYLMEGYERIKNQLPSNMTLSEEVGEVRDMYRGENGYKLIVRDRSGAQKELQNAFRYVLLATGHPTPKPIENNQPFMNLSLFGTNYVPFIYPVHPNLDIVSPNTAVGLKGMGLTFVDAVLALTEGRGGRFIRKREGQLTYEKSGLEPRRILPFSRNGLPMVARIGNRNKKKIHLKFFTPQCVSKLLSENRKLDFESELWPLITQDYFRTHYLKLFEVYQYQPDIDARQECSFEQLNQEIERFHEQYSEFPRFDLDQYFNPLKDQEFKTSDELHAFIIDYMEEALDPSKQISNHHFLMDLTDVWCAAAPLFGQIYANGGLTPRSQEIFTMRYAPMLHRVSYGPPSTSMEKILTLAKAGMIDFGTSNGILKTEGHEVSLTSQFGEKSFSLATLVNARIPKTDIRAAEDGLYYNLLDRKEICIYKNADHDTGEAYAPGCLALDKYGFVIAPDGSINTSIAATGTPTEGVTYDNDALSPARNNFVSKWSAFVMKEIKSTENYVRDTY